MMDQLWKAAGAAAWGAAAYSGLQPFLDQTVRGKLESLCPGASTVLAAAFPYYAGDRPGNLALYCRGEDYHRVLRRRLEPVCQALRARHPGCTFLPGADSSPVPELAAAVLAGVGRMGRHGLLVVPPYGSYVFLGTILTDLAVPSTARLEGSPCPPDCQACRKACPTGALSEKGCDVTVCLSEVTQKKGDLTASEIAQIRKSPTVWGCDLCQRACPLNRDAALSPLPEFREDLLDRLTLADLEGMSNKAFRRTYADRAFSWRGIGPLLRNLRLREASPTPAKGENPRE